MIPLEEARVRIARDIEVLPTVEVPVAEARRLVLAETVTATEAVPPFANTAMDGYALRAEDTVGATAERPVSLAVAGTVPAGGVAERPIGPGEAMRIMTGAPLPEGADAIIEVELTRPAGFDVTILAEVPPGNHVREAGDDVAAGAEIFHPGAILTPGHLGVLASLGRQTVTVYRRATVAVMSTGDELVEGSEPLRPGQIRDSNRVMLLALVAEAGCAPLDLGLVRDDDAAIRAALDRGVEQADAVITTGGVSMGDYDLVKAILAELGDFNWMQVAIRPAKPLAFGVMKGTPVFGLPGNPVSSGVSFELFARPALRRMMGRLDAERPVIRAVCDEPFLRRPDGKTHFMRVGLSLQADGMWHARSAGGQGSHHLRAMAVADGLAIVPDGDGIEVGHPVSVIHFVG
ncbi:MAG: gephyrin-like molybdotransferase Glp [Acidimicrobiales bacterium]